MRRAARTDAQHAEIVRALKAVGCSVLDLSAVGGGCPDVAVGRNGMTVLMEFKSARALKKDGTLSMRDKRSTDGQLAWRESWRGGPVHLVTSPDEALRAVGAVR